MILKRENEEYNIKEEFKMKNDWKTEKRSNTEYANFYQYFSSEVLPNNRLLLKSFSKEIWYGSQDVIPSTSQEYFKLKIIFIDK